MTILLSFHHRGFHPITLSRACICANVHEVEDHDPADVAGPPLEASTHRLHQRRVPWLRPHLPAGQQGCGREAGVGGMNWLVRVFSGLFKFNMEVC